MPRLALEARAKWEAKETQKTPLTSRRSLNKECVHLTNYSLNCKNPDFQENENADSGGENTSILPFT